MSDHDSTLSIEDHLKDSLNRLARFGANITDSHSCFLLLPPSFLGRDEESDTTLVIGGYHSLCPDIVSNCTIRSGSGLIGWVAKHAQPIHVSPFEHDSRTLGMYRDDRELKSFIGTPILLKTAGSRAARGTGVIACDSKKSFAFSKLQGKLLSDLAEEVAATVALINARDEVSAFPSWNEFMIQAEQTLAAVGMQSVDAVRLRIGNFSDLERALGTDISLELVQQLYRLIQQSLPPHFPHFQMPNGDMLIVMDNMMTSFYENRITALAEHIQAKKAPILLQFNREAVYSRKRSDTTLTGAFQATVFRPEQTPHSGDISHEYRRA